MLLTEIHFVYNDEFEAPDEDLLAWDRRSEAVEPVAAASAESPLFAALYETRLLTPDEERGAFRRMNYARFRANVLRSQLDPREADIETLDRIAELLDIANRTRDLIVRANLRLVVSIARRYVDPLTTFDDLIADGNVALLGAVDRFDYGLGFRFSTYATHAIQRTLYRRLTRLRRRAAQCTTSPQDVLAESVVDHRGVETDEEEHAAILDALLASVDERLNEREQYIVKARFALDTLERPRTLQVLSEEMGLCKERVRQLQLRALEKLKQALAERGLLPTI